MIDWLFDHFWFNLALLVIVVSGVVLGWVRSGVRLLGQLAVSLAALGLVFILLRLVVVTDRQQVRRSLEEIAANVNVQNPEGVMVQVSESFQLGGIHKDAFARVVRSRVTSGVVRQLHIWDLEVEASRKQRSATAVFLVKGSGILGEAMYRCKAQYVLDPDDRWRLKSFQLYNAAQDPNKGDPLPVPLH
ncbi:MAG: hypothetical protein NZ700_04105 [Gemmataceae bacterium]|nr:hypothetical protein [Gemmataceae bacterium]MDW8266103.1 hypothetical protein [Gemmataceae bacterium]